MNNKIRDEIAAVSYYIEESIKEGTYTLAFEQDNARQYILSKYYPRRQALEILGDDWGNKSTIWILFGFCFGYMLEEIFAKVGSETRVVIIEPNKSLLDDQISSYKEKELLKRENVAIITEQDIDEVERILSEFIPKSEFNNINIRFAEGYLRYYRKFYEIIIKDIWNIRLQLEVSFNTALANEEMYLKNTIRNGKGMRECYDLNKHRRKHKDVPVLIVGAGPSLTKNIDQIKGFRGIIMAVGRTMTPLMERGIRPDFVFSIDPFDVIYDTFGKYKVHDVPLVTLVNANSKVVSGSKGPKYFLHNSLISSTMLGLSVNPSLDLMGSVTTLCLSTARFMGCNPIIFVGQDLAFTEDKGHSEMTLSQDESDEDNDMTYETEMEKVKGYYDGQIKTNYGMRSTLSWIEYFIKHNKLEVYGDNDVDYVNATEGGAYIEGMIHMPLQEAIVKYCTKEKPNIIHEVLETNKDVDVEKKLVEAYRSLRNISKAIRLGGVYYNQLLDEYIQNSGNDQKKVIKLYEKINCIDKIISEIDKSGSLVQIIMRRIQQVLKTSNDSKEPIRETELEQRIRFLRLNHETYEQMANESKMLLAIIKGEMEK